MIDLGVLSAIVQAAKENGVDPLLAVATAYQESGLDPNAIGDAGCSFGLFQLNTCGGEGAGMSAAQLHDPLTNARRALAEFAHVQAQQPGLSPGQLAAAAQRPANPGAYASAVGALYQQLQQGGLGGLGAEVAKLAGLAAFPGAAAAGAGVQAGAGTAAGGSGQDCGPLGLTCLMQTLTAFFQRGFFIALGIGLVVLGLLLLVFGDFERLLKQAAPEVAGAVAKNPEVLAA